jgi:hypothetical protein
MCFTGGHYKHVVCSRLRGITDSAIVHEDVLTGRHIWRMVYVEISSKLLYWGSLNIPVKKQIFDEQIILQRTLIIYSSALAYL